MGRAGDLRSGELRVGAMSPGATHELDSDVAAKSAEIARLKEALKATTWTDTPGETAQGVAWEFGGEPESWGGLNGPSSEEVPDESKRAVAYRALRAIYDTSK